MSTRLHDQFVVREIEVVLDHSAWRAPRTYGRDGRVNPPHPLAMKKRQGVVRSDGTNARVCELWWKGLSQREIADALDIHHDRVMWAITSSVPAYERRLRERVVAGRKRQRLFRDRARPCLTCSRWFAPGDCADDGCTCHQVSHCCKEHYQASLELRFHTNPAAKQSHRVATARIAHRNNPTAQTLANLRRAETGTQQSQGRWFVKGSNKYHAARQAYLEGWPIFDLLPESCQDQIRASIVNYPERAA